MHMTMKVDAGGPVLADAEAVALDTSSVSEIKQAAETYRARKLAAPEVSAAGKAAQLEQACADLAYYSQLVRERTTLIKQLTAELNDGRDVDLVTIAAVLDRP